MNPAILPIPNQQVVTVICRQCGAEFQAEVHWGKLYCSLKCRRNAARRREKYRDRPSTVKLTELELALAKVTPKINNPTVTMIREFASNPHTLPVTFDGIMPSESEIGPLPPEVIFAKTAEGDWVMMI